MVETAATGIAGQGFNYGLTMSDGSAAPPWLHVSDNGLVYADFSNNNVPDNNDVANWQGTWHLLVTYSYEAETGVDSHGNPIYQAVPTSEPLTVTLNPVVGFSTTATGGFSAVWQEGNVQTWDVNGTPVYVPDIQFTTLNDTDQANTNPVDSTLHYQLDGVPRLLSSEVHLVGNSIVFGDTNNKTWTPDNSEPGQYTFELDAYLTDSHGVTHLIGSQPVVVTIPDKDPVLSLTYNPADPYVQNTYSPGTAPKSRLHDRGLDHDPRPRSVRSARRRRHVLLFERCSLVVVPEFGDRKHYRYTHRGTGRARQ